MSEVPSILDNLDGKIPTNKKKLVGWWPMIFVISFMVLLTIAFTYGSSRIEPFFPVPTATPTK